MGALLKLEERLERIVGGAFAKVFPSQVQPVEISAALQRECDNRAVAWHTGVTVVPNVFTVQLSPGDHQRLAPYGSELAAHFAESVRAYAREQRYHFGGPLAVHLECAADLGVGVFRTLARVEAAPTPRPAPARPRPAVAAPPAANGTGGPWLELDGRRVPLTRPAVLLGRSEEADIRIQDPGVSRRHARLVLGPPAQVVDLDSTNGLTVDGRPARRAELRDGTRIVIGSTALTYRRPEA